MTTSRKWQQVTVVGCGLIGASFALALKRNGLCESVLGWDTSPRALDAAVARGAIDDVDQALAAADVSASDLVYLAMPVRQIVRFLRERASQMKPGAVITDAGSTKETICSAAKEYLPNDRYFIGGHPIAGSHLSGATHASAELFTGAIYVLTSENPAPDSNPFNQVRQTVEMLGPRVRLMNAADHDRALALVSHLPQILSSVLAATIADQTDARELAAIAGSGFRDMIRLSGSSWSMWGDVLATNRKEIADALDLILAKVTTARDELRRSETLDDSEVNMLRRLFGVSELRR